MAFANPKTIVITGASSGIGAALAQAYAATDVSLGLVGRNRDRLDCVAAICRERGAFVETGCFDVTDIEAAAGWLCAFDDEHPIDLLISNAGISSGLGPDGEHETWAQINRVIDVNVQGALGVVTTVVTRMRARRRGQVALMSSLAAYRGLPSSPAYCASKAAVKVYGEALRGALNDYGIGVSVICPGYVVSPMSERLKGAKPFLLSADRAANIIRKGLAGNKACIAFPRLLHFGVWILSLLPNWAVERILKWFEFRVYPIER